MPSELGAVFVYGRLERLGRTALSKSLVNAGARLVRNPAQASTLVPAHRALEACVSADGHLSLPFARPDGALLMSERALKHRLAGASPVRSAAYTLEEVSRLAVLPLPVCEALVVFDVLGGGGRGLAYADLAAAREVAPLLRQGIAGPALIRAAWALEAAGARLSQVRLAAAPWGGLVQRVAGQLARLDGQYALVLDEGAATAAELFDRAQTHEAEGALEDAARDYDRAAQADRRDPLATYNRGNVLMALGREAEALVAFQQALTRDPAFAEAAFNLAAGVERAGQEDRAIALYRRLVLQHPDYAQAAYNLARLLTRRAAFAEALPLWERFIALAPDDADLHHAQRAALLCRLELRRS